MPRWILLALVLPFVLHLALRLPLSDGRWRFVALHLGIFLPLSLAHAAADSWGLGLASPHLPVLFPWMARVTRSWYNTLPTLISMYGAVLLTAWGMGEARERQRRTLRASQLESLLKSAQLAALRAQIQPHFLYNTLNGIAALVADERREHAVLAIEELAELLHASLRDDGREEISVGEEVALAERYLALQAMRFDERLRYECNVAPDVADCLVPVFLLQPIVENAVVHGLDSGSILLNVFIDASPVEDGIALTVENDGSRFVVDSTPAGHGIGLATTRARLAAAYGDRASLELVTREGGGVRVTIVVPRSHGGLIPERQNAAVLTVGAP
jgi:two-component system LytT family sensor kinase